MSNKAYTIKDIAELAQVSIGTVDRVIHNRGRVSQLTRDKVNDIIQQTGYTPNLQASRLAQGKTWNIAAMLPDPSQDNGFWQASLTGILRGDAYYRSLGMEVEVLHFDRYSPENFQRQAHTVLEKELDGLILAPVLSDPSREFIGRLEDQIPVVLIDTSLPGSQPLTFIGQDAYAAGQTAAHMLSLGCQDSSRLICVQIVPADYHIIQRTKGFTEFFTNRGEIAPQILYIDEQQSMNIEGCIDQLFLAQDEPMGIYVTNALVGLFAVQLKRKGSNARLIGHDVTPTNRELVATGQVDFLLSQHPITQSTEALRILYEYLAMGRESLGQITMPIEIITRENLAFSREN